MPTPPYAGVRLGLQEMIRATEQTAIIMSVLMGNAAYTKDFIQRWSSRCMLNFLRDCYCSVKLLPLDIAYQKHNVKEVFDVFENRKTHSVAYTDISGNSHTADYISGKLYQDNTMNLELVALPIDGARAFVEGRSGSLSVIAAGEPGSFVGDTFLDGHRVADEYFVIATSEEYYAKNATRMNLESGTRLFASESGPFRFSKTVGEHQVLEHVIDKLVSTRPWPTVGMTFEHERGFWINIQRHIRRRNLEGSSVAGALAAFKCKVDLSLFISRASQLRQIAVAAKMMNGHFLAIPLERRRFKADSTHPLSEQELRDADAQGERTHVFPCIDSDAIGRTQEDFALKNNLILVATSITEVCLMDRIRHGLGIVSCETMAICLPTRSFRKQTHNFDLQNAWFRGNGGQVIEALVAIDQMLQWVKEDGKPMPGGGHVAIAADSEAHADDETSESTPNVEIMRRTDDSAKESQS